MSSETTGASGIAGRYAAALFELADERKALDAVLDDLSGLQAMTAASADLRRLLRSPVISREDQDRAMEAIAEQAGLSELTRRFVGLVGFNRRLFALADMIGAFRAIVAARRGEVTAEVVSAAALSEGHLARLGEALRASVGGKVAIESRVDPDLLGGLVVKVGSRMVDSSLRTKLQKLQFALKGAA